MIHPIHHSHKYVTPTRRSRPGIALLVVVIVIALLTTSALTFAVLMQQSNQTARTYADQQQSQWAVESAIAQMECLAALPPGPRESAVGADSTGLFLRSLTLQSPVDAGGSLGSLGAAEEDWVTDATGTDAAVATDWETSLLDQDQKFDTTQPGFLIFDWEPGSASRAMAANSTRSAGGLTSSMAGNSEITLRLGWTNESSKLHLSRLMRWEAAGVPVTELLQRWCGLSPQESDRMLDWLDADDQPRDLGDEAAAYAQRGLRYQPANHVPARLDTLLLVPGISPSLLYGQRQMITIRVEEETTSETESARSLADFGRSQQAQIDRDLQAGAEATNNADEREVLWELGLMSRLTVTAAERHQNRNGRLKLPINHRDLTQLFAATSSRLDPNLATYVCLARQHGLQEETASALDANQREITLDEIELDLSQPATTEIASLISLIDSYVRVPQADGSLALVRSPLRVADLQEEFAVRVSEVFEQMTAADRPVTESRLHWQLSDPALLAWIPGLSSETQILLRDLAVSGTETPRETGMASLAAQAATWYRDGKLDRSQWQIVDRELTDGGDVYSAYIGAHAGDFRAFRWGQVMVDASGTQPEQVYYRELLPPPPTLQAVLATLNESALE